MELMSANGKPKSNGTLFEEAIAERLGGTRYGGKGQPDVVLEDGRVLECKFFTRSFDRKSMHAIYNYANGFVVRNREALLADLRAYCDTFDVLAVGIGDIRGGDGFDVEYIDSDKAFQWLAARIYAKGAKEIRFGYDADTTKAGGDESRLNTLAKHGFALVG